MHDLIMGINQHKPEDSQLKQKLNTSVVPKYYRCLCTAGNLTCLEYICIYQATIMMRPVFPPFHLCYL